MHTLKLALLHADIRHKEPQQNCETLIALIRQAAKEGARIVVTPEMAISGYSFTGRHDILPHTETEDGPILSAIAEVVQESGIYLCAGLATREKGSGILHNSALVFGPNGRILCRYRKINAESRWACPGDPMADNTFATPWGRTGVLICSDSYHSLMSRVTALRGADLLLIPANWPPTGLVPQEVWRARALENGFTVAACNRTGIDLTMDCREASSAVFDGAGKTMFEDRCPQSRVFVIDLPLTTEGRLTGQRRRQCLAARPLPLAHDCYLNLASIGDLTSFLQLPPAGRLLVNCPVPKRAVDDTLSQLSLGQEEPKEPAPILHLLPAAAYSDMALADLQHFATTGDQAIILRRTGRGEDLFFVFKGTDAPRTFAVAPLAGRDEQAPWEFHHGTAKICLAPFSLLRHPEFCLAAAKRGCDVAVSSEYHLTGDDLLLAGARTVENLALGVCAVNRAGIWTTPEGHQRWGEILAKPGEICRSTLDTTRTRKKRFQDKIDFACLMSHGCRALLPILIYILFANGTAFAQGEPGEAKVVGLSEMVVSAEKIEEYVKNHPQDVKIVERKEIVERNLANVEDVLKTMPGVEVYSTPGIGSRISIRGSGRGSGVLVLQNGRPLNSNQYGSQDLNAIPVDSIESISVFKPPVPVWLGPGGSDGAINIVTRSETAAKDKETAHSTAKVGGGSYGFAEGGLSHRMPLSGGNALVSATTTHRDGARTNSDRTDGALAMNWNRKASDGSSYEIGGRYYQAEFGSPGPLDNLTPNARQEYQKLSIDSKYQRILGETGTLNATLYGDSMSLEDRAQSGATATLDDHKIGLKADTTWSEDSGAWDLRLGISSEWDEFDHTLAGGHHRFRNGISSQYDRRFGEFTPTIGLRGDHSDDFGFNPGLVAGLGWGITKEWLIKVKGGYAVNIPTFEQLYQTTHGSIDQSRGNSDLNEERVWSYDLGIEYTFAKDLLLQMTIFRADTSDLITSQRGEDLIYRPTNLDRALRQGVEVTGKYSWKIGLTSETSLTFQDSENRDTGKELPYTPNVKAKETLSYTLAGLKTRIEGTIRYEGSRFSQMENLPAQKLDDYTVVGVKLTQPFMLAGMATDGYLKADNLFDNEYQSHFGYPADGLIISAGLQIRL